MKPKGYLIPNQIIGVASSSLKLLKKRRQNPGYVSPFGCMRRAKKSSRECLYSRSNLEMNIAHDCFTEVVPE